MQALIQQKARVLVHTSGLRSDQLRAAWFEPVDDVARCVQQLLDEVGASGRLAVLPEGPQTIPYLVGQ